MKNIGMRKAFVKNMKRQGDDGVVLTKQASVLAELTLLLEAVHSLQKQPSMANSRSFFLKSPDWLCPHFLLSQLLSQICSPSVLSYHANQNLPLHCSKAGDTGQDHGQRFSLPITAAVGKLALFLPRIPGRGSLNGQRLLYPGVNLHFSNFLWSGISFFQKRQLPPPTPCSQDTRNYHFCKRQLLNV